MTIWQPSIDPLGLLEQHNETLKDHDSSILNIAHAVNANASTVENLVKHLQQIHADIYMIRQDIERLKEQL